MSYLHSSPCPTEVPSLADPCKLKDLGWRGKSSLAPQTGYGTLNFSFTAQPKEVS